MPAFLLIPAGYWLAGAVGTALGVGAVVAASDTVDDFGKAADKTTKLVNSVSKAVLLAGTAYVAWQNRDAIMRLFK